MCVCVRQVRWLQLNPYGRGGDVWDTVGDYQEVFVLKFFFPTLM